MANLIPAHISNDKLGLTAWSSEAQAYYLVPITSVVDFFLALEETFEFENMNEFKENVLNLLATYSPEDELVLLTCNEDLLTVAVVSKDSKPTLAARAEQIDWSLDKLAAFAYLVNIAHATNDQLEELFNLTGKELDSVLTALYS